MKENNKLTIKGWAVEDRPREKYLLKGVQSLSDAELIAILIRSGTKDDSAVELARKILHSVKNNLNELGKLTIKELTSHKGIGETKAITIIAALELGRRRKISVVIEKGKVIRSEDVYKLMQPVLCDISHEEFWILLLNRSNKIIEKSKVSQGGLTGTVIDTRIIMKYAIDKLATSLVLCHNHPSGNVQPSAWDIKMTKRLTEAGKVIEIPVMDHVIISENSFFSFKDEGIL